MKCSGLSAISGERIEIEFGTAINNVDPLLTGAGDDSIFVAPGFVDLQVNGFAGVDFNSLTRTSNALSEHSSPPA